MINSNVSQEIKQTNARLQAKLLQHLPKTGHITTAIPGLSLCRHDEAFKCESYFYEPTIGIVVQGFKHLIIGNHEYQYGEYQYMVARVDVPSLSHVSIASPQNPFLALFIKLDGDLITQLMVGLTDSVSANYKNVQTPTKGIIVDKVNNELLSAFLRLVELLDHPDNIAILAPMILREIHYHLLTGPQGESLRVINTDETPANRIAKSIRWLRDHYQQPLDIDSLAQDINMAPSSFHRHFRRITTLTPLQFQKHMRLYEAERLMLVEGYDTLTAADKVGYENATQFNREYKRLFGQSPHHDMNNKRSTDINTK